MTVPQLQIPSHRRNVAKKVPVPLRVREEHQDRCRQVTVPLSLGLGQKHEDRRDKVSRCVTEAGDSEEKVKFFAVYFVRLLFCVKMSYTHLGQQKISLRVSPLTLTLYLDSWR